MKRRECKDLHFMEMWLAKDKCSYCKHVFTSEEIRIADLVTAQKDDEYQQEYAWDEKVPKC